MRIMEVETGTVKTGGPGVVLRASALGSCIGVAAIDQRRQVAGLAHVMLPGSPSGRIKNRNRYAGPAIRSLLAALRKRGCGIGDLAVCLAGAGNVLKRDDDTVCADNIRSVTEILRQEGCAVAASSLGGTSRRSITVEPAAGIVWCTVGNAARFQLYKP